MDEKTTHFIREMLSDSDVSDNEIEDVNDWSTASTSGKGRPKSDRCQHLNSFI